LTSLRIVENTAHVEEKAVAIVDEAQAIAVNDSNSYLAAGNLWRTIGDMIKEVKDTFDPICEAAHKAHKAATEKRAKYLTPLADAQRAVKSRMSAYDAEQERLRRIEQARLAEIARKEEEARRKAELERLEAERKAEEERILSEAIAAEESGDSTTAEALTNQAEQISESIQQEKAAIASEPVYVPPVVLPKATPKMQGGPVYRTVWKFEVINATLIPREYLIPDTGKIGGICRALKGAAQIPGVRFYEERV
jgi:uncharacterized membrane protein YqiK